MIRNPDRPFIRQGFESSGAPCRATSTRGANSLTGATTVAVVAALVLCSCGARRRLQECELVVDHANRALNDVSALMAPPPQIGPPRSRWQRYRLSGTALEELAEELQGLAVLDRSLRQATRQYAAVLQRAGERAGKYARELKRQARSKRPSRRASRRRQLRSLEKAAGTDGRSARAARERIRRICRLQRPS